MDATKLTSMEPKEADLVVEIWSHAKSPPLRPPAAIHFDIRNISNPPKLIRKQHDGRSKRLREHLLRDVAFVELLDFAEAEILKAQSKKERTHHSGQLRNSLSIVEVDKVTEEESGGQTPLHCQDTGSEGKENGSDWESESESRHEVKHLFEEERDNEEQNPGSEEDMEAFAAPCPDLHDSTLRVSCFCVRGQHRSVAFAEELGRRSWPRGWSVQVHHRDVLGRGKKLSSRRDRARGRGNCIVDLATDDD